MCVKNIVTYNLLVMIPQHEKGVYMKLDKVEFDESAVVHLTNKANEKKLSRAAVQNVALKAMTLTEKDGRAFVMCSDVDTAYNWCAEYGLLKAKVKR